MDTYLFYIRYRVTNITTEYPTFQISFRLQGSSSHQIYRRTINPINLLSPIKEVFQTFLNRVKELNLVNETPKFSPNALEELDQHVANFEVEILERLVETQNNPHHCLQADTLRIQNFLHHYFKDLTLNDQTIPQIQIIFYSFENILDSIINNYGHHKINLLLQHFQFFLHQMNAYRS